MNIVLDTCAILWAVSEQERLTAIARKAILESDATIYVSPISCAELACGVLRGRLTLDRHWKIWFRHFIELNNWNIVPIDLDVMEESYSLPEQFHADPADRIIVATARLHDASIITADKRIIEYAHVKSCW